MKAKKLVREYERQLEKEPYNLVLRVKLAAAMREVGRIEDAVGMYRSVALAYQEQGRLAQAIAVCRSVLEVEPSNHETQELLRDLDAQRVAREGEPDPDELQTSPGWTPPRGERDDEITAVDGETEPTDPGKDR